MHPITRYCQEIYQILTTAPVKEDWVCAALAQEIGRLQKAMEQTGERLNWPAIETHLQAIQSQLGSDPHRLSETAPESLAKLYEETEEIHRMIVLAQSAEEFGVRLHYYPQLISSLEWVQRLAEQNAPEGLAVVAGEILQAVGRHQRPWEARAGGFWATILLRPAIAPHALGLFSYLASLCVLETIRALTCVEARIKWPNDLIVRGNRKLCGILSTGKMSSHGVAYIIWGIGVNIRNSLSETLRQDREYVATTLHDEGAEVSPKVFADCFFEILIQEYTRLRQNHYDFSSLVAQWRNDCATMGKRVRIVSGHDLWEGHARDIDPTTGNLLLQESSGNWVQVSAGDCWHLEEVLIS